MPENRKPSNQAAPGSSALTRSADEAAIAATPEVAVRAKVRPARRPLTHRAVPGAHILSNGCRDPE